MKSQKEITAFKKHLNVLCFLCTVIIPVLNNFILSLILSFISGDIMLVFWAELLEAFVVALDTVNLFLVFGVLINSVARFGYKNSGRVIAFCTVRIAIIYASYIAIGAIVTSSFAYTLVNNLLYCFTNAAIDILLLVGAVFLISFLRSRFKEACSADESVGGILSFKNPMNTFLLTSPVNEKQIKENVAAGSIELTSDEILWLDLEK